MTMNEEKDANWVYKTLITIILMISVSSLIFYIIHINQNKFNKRTDAQLGINNTCLKGKEILKEIKKAANIIDADTVPLDENNCSIIFMISDNSMSFIHEFDKQTVTINTFFSPPVITSEIDSSIKTNEFEVIREITKATSEYQFLSDSFEIKKNDDLGKKIRIYIEHAF